MKGLQMPAENFFGIDFNVGSRADVLDRIKLHVKSKRNFEYMVTPNINHLAMLDQNTSFRTAYSGATLTICDSKIILLFLRYFITRKLPCYFPGSDIVEELFSRVVEKGDRVAIVGCEDYVVDKLRYMFPNILFEHINPPMGFINSEEEVEKVLTFISEIEFEYLFLSVGCPRQEQLAHMIKAQVNPQGFGFCVGAALLFLAGALPRAPKLVRYLCLEWLYRVISEPRRLLLRYLSDASDIIPIFFREWRTCRQRKAQGD